MDLNFLNPGQSNISEDLRNKLQRAAKIMGRPFDITSGHRDAAYNRKVGGARKSYHVPGKAVDIDMSPYDDAGRAKLVDTLRKAGLTGFGTYDKSPNMLHVDMRPQPNFMHNKSRRNIASAPKWFQAIASGNAPQQPAAPQAMTANVSGPGAPMPEPNQPALPPMTGGGMTLPSSMFEGPLRELMAQVPPQFTQGAMMPGRHPPVPVMGPGMPSAAPGGLPAPPAPAPSDAPPSMMAGVGGLMGALGGGAGDSNALAEAERQGQAAAQQRMQWALANGFGRGLV